MQGKAVLHPIGFDAFGLPAEEHAIRTGTPPVVSGEDGKRALETVIEIARLVGDERAVEAATSTNPVPPGATLIEGAGS